MRNSCWDCVRKHLSQASVLLDETHLGYPHHRWLAAGHMAEAESEVIGINKPFAERIREVRCMIMDSFDASFTAVVEDLIIEACMLAGEDDVIVNQTAYSSKKFAEVNRWLETVPKVTECP